MTLVFLIEINKMGIPTATIRPPIRTPISRIAMIEADRDPGCGGRPRTYGGTYGCTYKCPTLAAQVLYVRCTDVRHLLHVCGTGPQ